MAYQSGRDDSPAPGESPRASLRHVAVVFLRLGLTAFGGPAAHVAMMEEEVVRRRGWLTHAEFLDLLGATNLIPGPNSTEMAIHIGQRVAGWKGFAVAGLCFILPAALIVASLAWCYVAFRTLPPVAGLLYGVKPVLIAVVAQALWKLGRTAVRSRFLALVGAAAVVLAALGVHELAVLFGTGLVLATVRAARRDGDGRRQSLAVLGLIALVALLAGAAVAWLGPGSGAGGATAFGLSPLFLIFLKVGAVLFGSGYVLLAYLRADLVERHGWLTEGELLDAVAVGQVTPGPVFTTATFVGYLLAGPVGAAVATVAIFLPAFVFVAASGPLVPRLRRSAVAGAFLDGVNVASVALMAVVAGQLGRSALVDGVTVVLALAAAALLLSGRVNSAWLVLAGGAVGVLRAVVGGEV
ncbi:chromate efflux transporter [Gemmata sp.]|uniref:chromate efflux transporter n=1 Tax=Gemmata sp. TaxID=1914242 RepID=UPI003F6FE45F